MGLPFACQSLPAPFDQQSTIDRALEVRFALSFKSLSWPGPCMYAKGCLFWAATVRFLRALGRRRSETLKSGLTAAGLLKLKLLSALCGP